MCKEGCEISRYFVDIIGLEARMGDFFDAELRGENIFLLQNGETVAVVRAGEAKPAFKYRKKLKGVVSDIKDGVAKVQIVRWADLHRHSGYSLLDGASHIRDLVEKTEYVGAITDHGVMFGVLDYYKKMKDAGRKPIIGFEAYIETLDGKKEGHHVLLLAKNMTGFKNLMKLTSLAYENFYRKPHVTYDILRQYSEGIIATSACIGNEVPQRLLAGDYEGAKHVAQVMIDIFGRDNYYIEIQRHGFAEEARVNPLLIQLARELELKIVAGIDSHYTNKEDAKNHEILLCIQTGKTMSDTDRMSFPGTGYHIHTAEEVEELFRDLPEAIDATLEIAEKCNLELEFGKRYMPHFDVPAPFANENEYFKHLCWQGFEDRFKGTEKYSDLEYRNRLKYEIEVIEKMGFEGYFLIVWDFIRFAKENGILVGPGRGSVVGSLAAFCMKITDLDPIPYGLLFERFLNPERISMPDIDVDFQDDRRDEVIEYVRRKYGEQSVAKIVTFGTMKARAVVRDVARALDKPYSVGDRIAKAIPTHPKMTLQKAFDESPEFKQMYDSDPEVKEIINIAMKFEGLPRHASQHACGVVIAPSAISNFLPEMLMENELGVKERTSQFVMTEAEEMGLLKMDFLGLRTMTVIAKVLDIVNKKRAKDGLPPLNYSDIPLNDKKVYEDIARGETFGVFQLESAGMRSFMKELFADAAETEDGSTELFERLIAGVSLYRPGPMDSIPEYLKNMHNPDYIQYAHPILEPILKNTYGQIVYQEQVMQIVRDMAGYSLGRSDLVRRAMGKKKAEIMEQEKAVFIDGRNNDDGTVDVPGCVRNGIPREVAEEIWDIMAKFAEYAFNKSHAAAYAMIGVITAYLKYYYPVEYMTALINSYITNADRLKMYLSIIKKMGIEILPPDVNKSEQLFSVDNGKIRFGIQGIKNLGKSSENIIDERKRNGEFKSFQDFAERMAKHSKVDKKILEAMIYSGALDSFEGTRRSKVEVMDKILASASEEKKMSQTGQVDLFSIIQNDQVEAILKIEIPALPEYPKKFKLEKEREFAGFYVTEHPLDEYSSYFEKEGVLDIALLMPEEEEQQDVLGRVGAKSSYEGEEVVVAGIVTNLRLFYTKKEQKKLYVFTLEDRSGEIKAVCFSDRVDMNQDKLVEGKVVLVQGGVKSDDFGTQIIVKNMFDVEAIAKSEKPKAVWIKATNEGKVKELLTFVQNNSGNIPVYFLYGNRKYKSDIGMDLNLMAFSKLQDMFGTNVRIVYK